MNSLKISLTRNIPCPNIYVKMLSEFHNWIYIEEQARTLRGNWKSVFGDPSLPLDLEIGCGNGFFFEHRVKNVPNRNLLGIEIKYKPLVQTVRRAKRDGLPNARGLRFNAKVVDQAFEKKELDNVFIYFPDPWPRRSQRKNRLMQRDFFLKLFELQKCDSFVDIKTDSRDYFDFAQEEIRYSPYEIIRLSRDLHHSEWAVDNFSTSFEKIFLKKDQVIYYARLLRK